MVRAAVDFFRGACFLDFEPVVFEPDFELCDVLAFFFELEELLLLAGCSEPEELCAGAMPACSRSAVNNVAVKRDANIV